MCSATSPRETSSYETEQSGGRAAAGPRRGRGRRAAVTRQQSQPGPRFRWGSVCSLGHWPGVLGAWGPGPKQAPPDQCRRPAASLGSGSRSRPSGTSQQTGAATRGISEPLSRQESAVRRFREGQPVRRSPGKGQLGYSVLDLTSSPGTGSGRLCPVPSAACPLPLGGPFRCSETFLGALPGGVGAHPSLDPFPLLHCDYNNLLNAATELVTPSFHAEATSGRPRKHGNGGAPPASDAAAHAGGAQRPVSRPGS